MTNNLKGRILSNTNQFIAVHKLPGESVQPDLTTGGSLLNAVANYCKHPVHLVNRLDKPTSGVVLFAKNKKAMATLSEQLAKGKMTKYYLAVTDQLPGQTGRIEHYIAHNQVHNKSYVRSEPSGDTQLAIMDISHLTSSDRYELLLANIRTGRHHQIRAQLASLGAHIKGDVKYGARRSNRDRSIDLIAWKLIFAHPVDKSRVIVTAILPEHPLWNAFREAIEEKGNEIDKIDP